jgi:hypothetical protein
MKHAAEQELAALRRFLVWPGEFNVGNRLFNIDA